jgi:hypothetical protein
VEKVRWTLTGRWGLNYVSPPYNSTTWENNGGPGSYAVQLEVMRGTVDRLSNVVTFTVTP